MPGVSDHRMLREVTAEAVEALVEVAGPGSGSPLLFIEVRQFGGAFARPPADGGGARAHFEEPFLFFSIALGMTPEMAQAGEAHAIKICETIGPWASERCYFNFRERHSDTSIGFNEEAYKRLREVKAKFDPDGMFQSNHEIEPD